MVLTVSTLEGLHCIGLFYFCLEPKLSVPDLVFHFWRKIKDKIQNGKPGFEAT